MAKKTISKRNLKKAKKKFQRLSTGVRVFIIVLVIILILSGVFLYRGGYLDSFLYPSDLPEDSNDQTFTPVLDTYDDFQIHFLELGNQYTGDSIYIKAGEQDILIDAGSRANSSTAISEYINHYVTDNKLEYVIATHAHQDHIAGFVGSTKDPGIFDSYSIDTLIDFARTNATTSVYTNYVKKRDNLISSGTTHFTAKQCFEETDGAKSTYTLFEDCTMTVMYNYYYSFDSSNENDYSVVIQLQYKDHYFLFTGDLEASGEEKMVEYYADHEGLSHVDLFKAGHHGSYTASTTKLLDMITPNMCVVCCVAGSTEYTQNLQNTFPAQDFVDRMSQYTDAIYVTSMIDPAEDKAVSMNGTIVVSSNGIEVGISMSNNNTKLKDTAWFIANRTWSKKEEKE